VGTASIEESELLSALLGPTPHAVLNARDDEAEAAIIARAGERGAITVSTNMAGRGVDIRLGAGVAELGGLVVIGVNKHESRRIDNQLRGRAGRQGDPGESLFLTSLADDLMVKNAGLDPRLQHDPSSMQRFVEGQHLDIRLMLSRYESVIEGQRQRIQARRQAVLTGAEPSPSERHRLILLREIDDAWSSYLAAVADLRSGVQWLSLGGRLPWHEYLQTIDGWFRELEETLDENAARRVEASDPADAHPHERGAVWTYLTTDQPFGTLSERIIKGLARKARTRSLWA
jgi:preprotein translocase subunit SecA